ncbi:hypothetical protein C8Q72DRAFT_526622 [Fomitopsis betulina]|nr:hypothetical protein C8Q72DRAFT_526622 [Fomitopsis betulina]
MNTMCVHASGAVLGLVPAWAGMHFAALGQARCTSRVILPSTTSLSSPSTQTLLGTSHNACWKRGQTIHELHQPKGGGRCNTNGTLVDKRDERFSRAHIGTTQDGNICRRSRKLVEKELGRINMSSVHADLRLPTAIQ